MKEYSDSERNELEKLEFKLFFFSNFSNDFSFNDFSHDLKDLKDSNGSNELNELNYSKETKETQETKERQKRDELGPFLPELLPISSCIPYLYLPNKRQKNHNNQSRQNGQNIQEYAQAHPQFSSQIVLKIQENTNQLKRIKGLHSKITLLQSGKSLDSPSLSDPIPLIEFDRFPITKFEKLNLGKDSAHSLLSKSISLLCSHVGFDSIYKVPLEVFTSVIEDYLFKLTTCLLFFIQTFGNEKSFEEILVKTLMENGIQHPNELQRHLDRDVDHYGKQLSNIHLKFQHFIESFTTERDSMDHEMTLEEEQDLIAR